MRARTILVDPRTTPPIVPSRRIGSDPDYLAALLHARRSRMAEARRLDDLCRIRTLAELIDTIFPGSEVSEVLDFQRMSVHELVIEILGLRAHISGSGADLVDWTLVRFQAENLKVWIRACLKKVPKEDVYVYLVPLPAELALDAQEAVAAESPEDLLRLVPKGFLRDNLEKALETYRDHHRLFFLEAALDCGYFQGLVARTERLSREDREIVRPMICQETDIFHLMLATRGKHHYGLAPEMLLPFHVAGTRITRAVFAAMLNDPDISRSMSRIAGRVFDTAFSEPVSNDGSMALDASVLEGLAWNRFFRLANLAFRQSHMGLGTVMGYVGLRRVEVANLITISEGIRNGMEADTIRERLTPRTDIERAYA
jgi:vacuolar-type H+-ATPase subunit C/Vma6